MGGLKRVQKLFGSTEDFETISQPDFWAPFHFSPKLTPTVKIDFLWFSIRISRQKSFTETFVENYVALARGSVSSSEQAHEKNQLSVNALWVEILTVQSISQIILESEQSEFFLKLVSDLSEKPALIPTESQVENMKSHRFAGNFRALVKCASCGVLEKSEKEFQKCSRCGFVFYCSKACQRNDWQNHKQVCKEIRKQN